MPVRTQLIFAFWILLATSCIIIAYQKKEITSFWRWHDSGMFLLATSFLGIVRKHYILSMVCIILLALVTNSLITSFFFNVTIFGLNQYIFGWIMAIMLLIAGIMYNVLQYIITKRKNEADKLCKRDALKRYRDVINNLNSLNKKFDTDVENINKTLQYIIGKINRHE